MRQLNKNDSKIKEQTLQECIEELRTTLDNAHGTVWNLTEQLYSLANRWETLIDYDD